MRDVWRIFLISAKEPRKSRMNTEKDLIKKSFDVVTSIERMRR